jgi:flagellar basal body-associated protein FliL
VGGGTIIIIVVPIVVFIIALSVIIIICKKKCVAKPSRTQSTNPDLDDNNNQAVHEQEMARKTIPVVGDENFYQKI